MEIETYEELNTAQEIIDSCDDIEDYDWTGFYDNEYKEVK